MTLMKRHLRPLENRTFHLVKEKIYLDYCIKQNPEYIIVDNPLDSFRPGSKR
jgi:hypothetical protein